MEVEVGAGGGWGFWGGLRGLEWNESWGWWGLRGVGGIGANLDEKVGGPAPIPLPLALPLWWPIKKWVEARTYRGLIEVYAYGWGKIGNFKILTQLHLLTRS